jgi:uncharacterized protein YceH (UPF0502 family)/SAM-dependent methyltransferase
VTTSDSLLEKERTVPASYPMTPNALRTACNQSSGRNPVLDLTEREITEAIDRLKADGLARVVHASHGARTVKYRQVLDERLELSPAGRAVLTLLLLRGAQTPGELRTRADRLHTFSDVREVEATLTDLADRDQALVAEQPRRPGQKETRWVHLLGPVADPPAGAEPADSSDGDRAASTGAATEHVLRDGPIRRTDRVRDAYDTVADEYAARVGDELDAKPFDRWLLERLAELAGGSPVADVGTGPGHVAFHLAAAGAEVTGFDLSPGMVAVARRRYPELDFEVADLTDLPALTTGAGWGAIVAWYSLIHLAASELPPAVAILTAGLRPGGWLAVAVHLGDEVKHVSSWWDLDVDVDAAFHRREALLVAYSAAGLVDVEWYERSPIPGAEYDSNRLYVIGRRPS